MACADADSGSGALFRQDPNSVLRVKNNSGKELVLFASRGAASNAAGDLLCGVSADPGTWGVPGVSPTNGMFVLNIVAWADYRNNAKNPRIASSLLVYVDDEPVTHTISAGLGGDGVFRFYNWTDNYVEVRGGLRDDSPSWYSPAFVVLRPKDAKSLYCPVGDYDLYPVMILERRAGGKIVGLIEKKLSDLVHSYSLTKGYMETVEIPASVAAAEHAAAYIAVLNRSGYGLTMLSGSRIIMNSLGREVIRAGGSGGDGTSDFVIPVNGNTIALLFTFTRTQGQTFAHMSEPYEFTAGRVYEIAVPPAGGAVAITPRGTYESFYGN